MRLVRAQVTNFQSIHDSTEFEIGDVTCLVGKNEAGKTALLKALYRLNPVIAEEAHFDPTDDYPRRDVSEYKQEVEAGEREPAEVVRAVYELEHDDVQAVQDTFGSACLEEGETTLTLSRGYGDGRTFTFNVNEQAVIQHAVDSSGVPAALKDELRVLDDLEEIIDRLEGSEVTEQVTDLIATLTPFRDQGISETIYTSVIRARIPRFLYFDEYFQMTGEENIDALQQRVSSNALRDSDHPLLGLIELAGLELSDLTNPGRTEALLNRLEAAENQLTERVLRYWSQNRHLRMSFDIRQGQPEDPPGLTSGMNIWGRVRDTKHMVSTGLGTRSRGFVWFFSFLAWYSKVRREDGKLILLLDEPGLSLHAKAQADLLRYFDEELVPHHQLLYTTHSPFMVDPTRFDRIRIVQDLSIEADPDEVPEDQQGTKVITEVLDASGDSLFPLQGALGYEISQTLFLGRSCLVVEGVSDLIYLQSISALLQEQGRAGLDSTWTITPVGGADKIPTFVALIGAQSGLHVAVLADYGKSTSQTIDNLYKRKLLRSKDVITFSDILSVEEADIEDMFDPEFYLRLVNEEYGSALEISKLPSGSPRILRRIEQHLETHSLPADARFNHYRPARYFNEHLSSLRDDLSEEVLDRFQRAFDEINALL